MKKFWPAGTIILLILLVAGAAINLKKSAVPLSPLESGPTATPAEKFLTWEDPAGFTFGYPGEIKINNHPEDVVNYANLELTAVDHKGQIKILMADNSFKTLGDWQKSLKLMISDAAEIKLGGQSATRLNGDSLSPLVAAIDGNALVLIQGFFGEESYWQPIYDQILASFEFIPLASEPTPPAAKSGSSGAGVIEEEEEEIVK